MSVCNTKSWNMGVGVISNLHITREQKSHYN